jgi:hypothetical protein
MAEHLGHFTRLPASSWGAWNLCPHPGHSPLIAMAMPSTRGNRYAGQYNRASLPGEWAVPEQGRDGFGRGVATACRKTFHSRNTAPLSIAAHRWISTMVPSRHPSYHGTLRPTLPRSESEIAIFLSASSVPRAAPRRGRPSTAIMPLAGRRGGGRFPSRESSASESARASPRPTRLRR